MGSREVIAKDDDFYKRVLTRSQTRFVEDLNPTPILDLFLEKEFLPYNQVRDIRELPSTSKQTRQILNEVTYKGFKGYGIFKKLLKKAKQGNLAEYLNRQEAILEKEMMAEKKNEDKGKQVQSRNLNAATTEAITGEERIPDDKELITISSYIGMNWEMIGPFLGVKSTTVDQICMDNSTTIMKIYRLLSVWRVMNGSKATLKNLFLSLRKVPDAVNINWEGLETTRTGSLRSVPDDFVPARTHKGIIETLIMASNNNATGFGSSQQRQPMENAQERPNNNTGTIVIQGLQTMQGVQENYGSVNKGQLRAVGIQSTADERQTGSLTERKKLKAYIPPKNTCIFDGRLIKLEQADIDDLSKNNTIPIGQGSFGKVFKSENPSEGFGMHIVVKKIPLIGEEQNRSIIREMMASRIMHPFILPLLAVVDRPEGKPEVWFVSPRGNKGDLHGVIQCNSEDLNMEKRIKILLHIALAIQYIHTEVSKVREAVLHKDIASRNIVLDDNYNARLIDFGLARETSDTTSKASGRDFYAHPEIGKGGHAKEAWDYFAFGVSE